MNKDLKFLLYMIIYGAGATLLSVLIDADIMACNCYFLLIWILIDRIRKEKED